MMTRSIMFVDEEVFMHNAIMPCKSETSFDFKPKHIVILDRILDINFLYTF